jgi:uncharacterized coiled-coil DUF342 family protein
MNQVEQLERLINARFDAVHQRFDGLDREMRDVKADVREVKKQTTETNGRVNKHDTALDGIETRVTAVTDDVSELKKAAPGADTTELVARVSRLLTSAESGENRILRQWHLAAAVIIIGGVIAVLGFLGMLKKPGDVVASAPAAVIR